MQLVHHKTLSVVAAVLPGQTVMAVMPVLVTEFLAQMVTEAEAAAQTAALMAQMVLPQQTLAETVVIID